MFRDKIFQIIVFSRYVEEASHCYKNFELVWSFKYSKNIMISNKLWYSKQSFFTCLSNTSLKKIL
jgi:hypothetical protein